MDPNERSPSFLDVVFSKPNSEVKNSSKTEKFRFKPVPTKQLLQSLNLYSPAQQPSIAKKLSLKAVRTADLNLDEFKLSPKVSTKNVRKQLWPATKQDSNKWTADKNRRGTVMKPVKENLKTSLYSRPSLMQPKKSISKNVTKYLSANDTLPLMDMEQFTVTKIKRTLFSAPQPKPPTQRKTISHINTTKLPFVSSYAKKIAKPPSIVITPAEKSAKKSINLNEKTSNSQSKISNEIKDDRIDLLFDKISVIEGALFMICTHLGINLPSNSKNKLETQEPKETTNPKIKLSTPCFKRNGSSTPLPTIKEDINSVEFNEKVYKLSPFVIKTSNITNEDNFKVTGNNHLEIVENDTLSMKLKLSPCTIKAINNQTQGTTESSNITTNLQLEKIDTSTLKEANNQEHTFPKCESISASKELNDDTFKESKSNENSEEIINSNDVDEGKICEPVELVETPLNLKIIRSHTTSNQPTQNPVNLQDNFTPKTDKTQQLNNKRESTIKLKKTWITQFEQIENKLLNNSNISINLNSSPDVSPPHELQIDQIVNDSDATNQLMLKKSQSTSNESLRKKILCKSRENLLTQSISVYNELRDELPKFLSTPVSNTNKSMSLITPSVQNNAKKLVSRRVQEQLLKLNDY